LGGTLSIYGILLTGYMSWGAPFFARTSGWSIAKVGSVMGIVTLIGGLLGPLVGLAINRLVSRRLGREAPLAAICAMLVISLPFIVGGPLFASGSWAAVAFGVVVALTHGCGVLNSAVYASIAPSHLRARVLASLTLVFGVVASSGSVVYAAFTDHVVGDPSRLYVTMSLLSGLLTLASIVAAFVADSRFTNVVASARDAEMRAAA
jgi:MFS family permease